MQMMPSSLVPSFRFSGIKRIRYKVELMTRFCTTAIQDAFSVLFMLPLTAL